MDSKKSFAKDHETLWQFIKFFVFTQLAGLTEIVSYTLLKNTLPEKMPESFDFFVFHYTNENGLNKGLFVAFLVSAVLAEIVSFLVNRKATFNANNNLAKSALMYAVLVVFIICMKTWVVTVLTAFVSGYTQSPLLIEWIPKLASMVIAFAIIFPMNKFVIMRHTDEEK